MIFQQYYSVLVALLEIFAMIINPSISGPNWIGISQVLICSLNKGWNPFFRIKFISEVSFII